MSLFCAPLLTCRKLADLILNFLPERTIVLRVFVHALVFYNESMQFPSA